MTSAQRSTGPSERSEMEYNPTEELGFVEENQLIMSCDGILSKNDFGRDLCARCIRNGARFFDVVSRYEDLNTYALERDETKSHQTMKMIIPFLKAYGMTDHFAYDFAKESLDAFLLEVFHTFRLYPDYKTSYSCIGPVSFIMEHMLFYKMTYVINHII